MQYVLSHHFIWVKSQAVTACVQSARCTRAPCNVFREVSLDSCSDMNINIRLASSLQTRASSSLHRPQLTVLNESSFIPSVPSGFVKCWLFYLFTSFFFYYLFIKSTQMNALKPLEHVLFSARPSLFVWKVLFSLPAGLRHSGAVAEWSSGCSCPYLLCLT